ncbi:MAG: FKBP-type peptidyl-prolyl cis-trans isomerase [Bacteroidales bacterium]|nr:FKBP-type peptidyl-prolyl cis-trans isomerase [Bacteroidales bacterium]
MKIKALILTALFLIGWGCTKQSLKATYDKQAGYIDSFVQTQMKADPQATLVRNEGAWRLTLADHKDPGDSLLAGGQVILEYASYILTGASISASNLIETNKKEIADAANWKLSDSTIFQPVTLTLDKTLVDGLRMGLHGVQPGDEAYILFTGEYAYGNKENGTIPAKSAMVYHVWIESIKNE